MTSFLARRAVRVLRKAGVELRGGMSDDELDHVEKRLGFTFAADHRALLTMVLPVGPGWMDWRLDTDDHLKAALGWAIDGVLYDVERNDFWPKSWGVAKPEDLDEKLILARKNLQSVPTLVPFYMEGCVPAGWAEPGAPVVKAFQTVEYRGSDIANFLERTLGDKSTPLGGELARIPFWTDLAEGAWSADL
ncbi:hypothetical protein EV193_108271 [Herbihabitans rhizosphaerae]|uniref:SMI1/KNR4 family protein SUKH-1 n=1 Tax=Herbihabitans rhizosphaerae TaxID=1872711 RepID=A0A4Q7KIZ5_9PSEU|nr:SMI1/KNR4 family protein [Herbihabitans rhizosphaerae]RZS34921.1 hypothetical protein EV193_108271 [Herbihabitans rhizosphaerae]